MTPWGVGMYDDGSGRVPWECSNEEIQRDMGTATKLLTELGVVSGERVLFCSMLSEAAQFWPLIVGAMLNGAQLSCADANEGDAVRVAMFTQRLSYHAVLGVTPEILDGLDDLGRSYEDVFHGIPIIGARPGAFERLTASGLAPYHLVLCGPALAVGRVPHGPAFAAPGEWELGADDTRIVVSNLKPRATSFDRAPTAIVGEVSEGGVIPKEFS
jgi:hypothetical protein